MSSEARLIELFLGFMLIVGVFGLVVLLMTVIGLYKVFKKSGEEGWKAIVPIYNLYTLTDIVGLSPYWIIIILASSVISVIIQPLATLCFAVNLYFSVILCGSIVKSFGKSEAFGFGLFFASPIFYLILGFDSSQYLGKNPMKDPVMEFINENLLHKETPKTENTTKTTTETKSTTSKNSFCTNCGTKLDDDSAFCTNCGTKIK